MKTFLLGGAAAVFGAVLLSGCATATPYQPMTNGYGYSEQKIESNRFRVSFAGNSQTPRQTVENYLLYRAAELTLQAGYDYFAFGSNDTEINTRYLQNFSGYYGYGPYYWYPRAAFGVDTATPVNQYEAQASVVMFRGRKRPDDLNAFDAREVRSNLEPRIARPMPEQP